MTFNGDVTFAAICRNKHECYIFSSRSGHRAIGISVTQ